MKTKTANPNLDVLFQLDVAAAIRLGTLPTPSSTLKVTAAQIRAMRQDRREELARAVARKGSPPFGAHQWLVADDGGNVEHTEPTVTQATLGTLWECLDARIASRSKDADRKIRERELALCNQLTKERAALAAGIEKALYSRGHWVGDWHVRLDEPNQDSLPAYRQFFEEALAEMERRSAADKTAAEEAAKRRDIAEAAERRQRDVLKSSTARWVQDLLVRIDTETNCASLLRARYEAGCLPADTLHGLIRDEILAALTLTQVKYRGLEVGDLPKATHEGAHEVEYTTSRGGVECTAAQWARFTILNTLVESEVVPRLVDAGGFDLKVELVEHLATCTREDYPEKCGARARAVSVSVSFKLYVGGEARPFSREYRLLG